MMKRSAYYTLLLLAFSLPFELPLLTLRTLQLTNLELLLALTLLLTTLHHITTHYPLPSTLYPLPTTRYLLPTLLILTLLLTSLLAPEFRGNALKASGRVISGLLLTLTIPHILTTKRQFKWLIASIVAGGLLAITIGWLEVATLGRFTWLNLFRENATTAGPFRRLSASFPHANQTAMYIEATLPLLIALLITQAKRLTNYVNRGARYITRQNHPLPSTLYPLPLTIPIILYLQASYLTYSRTSFVTIIASCLLIPLVGRIAKSSVPKYTTIWAGVAGLTLILLGFNLWLNPIFRLRLSSEGDNEWYETTFIVPDELTVPAGQIITPTITIHNNGHLIWRSTDRENPIHIGGHWYLQNQTTQLSAQPRWRLDHTTRPGQTTTQPIPLQAPLITGTYRFEWDMVQEHIVWFSQKNGQHPSTTITVTQGSTEQIQKLSNNSSFVAFETIIETPQIVPPIPGRATLWRIALQQLQEHPLLGIGLDNYRLTYGPYLNQDTWNQTVHTNNWYIETIVSFGTFGSIPFLLAMVSLLIQILRNLHHNIWTMALSASLLTYFIHGLLDYFLLFNNTGLLFWLLIGLFHYQHTLHNKL